jgi:AraC-like DNA-binding protein
MNLLISLSANHQLEFQTGLPANYKGPVLHGSNAIFAKTSLADLVIQELNGAHYTVRLVIGHLLKKISAEGWINQRGLYSWFMLKNHTRKDIHTIGKFHVRQDQYACYFSDVSNCSALFEKNKEIRALDFYFAPVLLQELSVFFPELNNLLTVSPGALLATGSTWTIPSIKEITQQILDCPYSETTRTFYYDLKVRELLYQMLEHALRRKTSFYTFTPYEYARIHQARNILLEHISKKPPSIRALSKSVAINEFKLKAGFRQYFNAGVFEWLAEQKMQLARELVLTTNKPLKDICTMVGYPRITNFITAFRRRFGMSPGSLRRQ